MLLSYTITIVSTLIALTICIGLTRLIRRRLSPRFPVGAMGASIAVIAATLFLVAAFAGMNIAFLYPGLLVVVAFIGVICVQPSPWAASSILRALAVSAGGIAVVSVLTSDFIAATLAVLATGVLIRLYCEASPKSISVSLGDGGNPSPLGEVRINVSRCDITGWARTRRPI